MRQIDAFKKKYTVKGYILYILDIYEAQGFTNYRIQGWPSGR